MLRGIAPDPALAADLGSLSPDRALHQPGGSRVQHERAYSLERSEVWRFATGESLASALSRAGVLDLGRAATGQTRARVLWHRAMPELSGAPWGQADRGVPAYLPGRADSGIGRWRRGAPMAEQPVLIVGAGLAGMAAAVALAQSGIAVRVVDQAPRARRCGPSPALAGRAIGCDGDAGPRWQALMAEVPALRRHASSSVARPAFGGLDHRGAALLTGKGAALLHPRALILATGARERVQPRAGWTLPGVTTAGALQSAPENHRRAARRPGVAGGIRAFAAGRRGRTGPAWCAAGGNHRGRPPVLRIPLPRCACRSLI